MGDSIWRHNLLQPIPFRLRELHMPLRKVIGKMVGPSGRRLIWRVEAKLFARPYRQRLKGMRALEIGGPSDLFGDAGLLPVYSCLKSIDNVNYSARTLWQSEAVQFGETLVCEGTALPVNDRTYDCLFSSHSLEHIANPMKALLEWKRVIRDHGLILLVLPNRHFTFDWRRPVTTLDHLRDLARSGLFRGGRTVNRSCT